MPFYDFSQNNSGGSFDHDDKRGVGYRVIIEAHSANEANERAIGIGIYFDGVNSGMDCGCCGDRWSRAWKDDGTDTPTTYYGETPTGGWGIPTYVHFADGTIKKYE